MSNLAVSARTTNDRDILQTIYPPSVNEASQLALHGCIKKLRDACCLYIYIYIRALTLTETIKDTEELC